jgi:hypothetical protein
MIITNIVLIALDVASSHNIHRLHLSGGMDGFNLLTPHTSCGNYRSYLKNREVLALRESEMLPIKNDDPDQPCEKFGVHNAIPAMKDIYDKGHGIFFANIGHLHKPVTKNNVSLLSLCDLQWKKTKLSANVPSLFIYFTVVY